MFEGRLAAWGGIEASLNADGQTDLVVGVIASGNYFDVLGVRAALGRLLSPSDDVTPGAHPVAVISYRLWRGGVNGGAGGGGGGGPFHRPPLPPPRAPPPKG